jgi:carboxyl-terminal processing protease
MVISRVITIAFTLMVSLSCSAKTYEIPLDQLTLTTQQVKTTLVINQVLERFHYRSFELNEHFVRQALINFIDDLDPNRSFFLARDVNRFTNNENSAHFERALQRGQAQFAFELFRVYRARLDDRVTFALQQLQQPFDFTTEEFYQFDRADLPWPTTTEELDALWHLRIKNDALTLKLTDNKSDADIVEQLEKRYTGLRRRIHQFDAMDVFQAFMNAYTRTLEPHTAYMSPSLSENFDISMSLSLEGIGAILRSDNEYTVIQRTIPGGPARQSGQIQTGDRIVGVGQGLDGDMEDVVGWRLQDVVDKIRGPKGSLVRLQILPKAETGGRLRELSLIRNEIKLEDQAAHSYVLDQLQNDPQRRIGIIEIPAFYRDFQAESSGNRNFRSTTRDVRDLIRALKRTGIDGLVIDLRGNGGGSLTEATSLTGLFIKDGPVVQVKDSFGKIDVETDPDPKLLYTGPLAVLVDRNSASASEIFAGAIQDYGRGLIIGEPTFGKGTVQTLIDLNRYVPGDKTDFGRLRLTMAEFFRITGASTQLKGVEPDITFDFGLDDDHGERALDNPLPWGRIRAARYKKFATLHPEPLRQRSAERISQDPGFQMLRHQAHILNEMDEQKIVSLRESDRRTEITRRDQVLKQEKHQFLRAHGVEPIDEDADTIDEDALEKQNDIIARIQLKETARILIDSLR